VSVNNHMVSALIGTVWAQNPDSHPNKSRLKIVNVSKSLLDYNVCVTEPNDASKCRYG